MLPLDFKKYTLYLVMLRSHTVITQVEPKETEASLPWCIIQRLINVAFNADNKRNPRARY